VRILDKENLQDLTKKIESIFEFNQDLENLPTTFVEKVSAYEEKSNQLMNISQSEITTIEEKEYIDDVFKVMIDEGIAAFKILTKTIKVGISGKDMEGYSRFFDSLSMTLERMINYKMKLREINLMMNPEVVNSKQPTQNNFFLDGKGLADMMKDIKQNNQLNDIVVDFKVEDTAFEEKPKDKE
jgi:hypothetical protein